jgi:hypothetical protein
MSQTVVEKTAEHVTESAQQASCAASAIADAIMKFKPPGIFWRSYVRRIRVCPNMFRRR